MSLKEITKKIGVAKINPCGYVLEDERLRRGETIMEKEYYKFDDYSGEITIIAVDQGLIIGKDKIPYKYIKSILHQDFRTDDNFIVLGLQMDDESGLYPYMIGYNWKDIMQEIMAEDLVKTIERRAPHEIDIEVLQH